MQANAQLPEQNLGWFPYVVSLLSFIPLLGIPVGIISVVYGWKKRSRFIPVVGILGMLVSIALYGGLFYVNKTGYGVYGELQAKLLSETVLPDMVRAIEYYKLQNGSYPQSLEQLDEKTRAFVGLQANEALGKIVYEPSADKKTFTLLAVGRDKVAYTSDDILPKIEEAPDSKSGYRRAAGVRH